MMKAGSVAVAAALVVSSAFVTSASAQTAAEAKCRDAIAKSLARYAKTYFASSSRCHEARSAGALPLAIDCNDVDGADQAGKIARAAAKLRATVGGSANKCLGATNVLEAQYPECPPPAENVDDGAPTSGIDSFSEYASCLLALTDASMKSELDEGVGQPQETLQPQTSDCQQTLASSISRVVVTTINERRKCQRILDRQNIGLDYNCDGADPKGKIGRAVVKLNAAIEAGCSLPQSELAKINACSDTTVGLRQCVGDGVARPLGSDLVRNAYVLPGGGSATTTTVGPTTTTTLSNACGNTFATCDGDCPAGTVCNNTGSLCQCQSTGGCAPATIIRRYKSQLGDYPNSTRATQLSTGWSGTAHHVDIPGDAASADVVNVNCNANCENCNINLNPVKDISPAPIVGNAASYCRCDNNPRVACDTVNGPDTDCGGGINNTCTCYFGGPLAISAGGTPVCVLNKIKNDFGGTMNLRTGEWYDTTSLVSVVYLGLGTTAPCPTCVGASEIPNDGQRDGTCTGGVSSGTCDVNAVHPTFGPVSFDCPPNAATNISGNGLQINLKFTTEGASLGATLPCDPPGGLCPCRVCSGDGTLGCSSNADCQAAGAGNCTAGGGAGVQPNQCDDRMCTAQGRCNTGPQDTFCDGTTHPDGRGFITCVADADCAALGQGTCTISERRRCYTDPIIVLGDADPADPIRGAVFCIPPTTSAAVNASGGIPGPGTFTLEFSSDIRCQDDIAEAYQLPDGANCGAVASTTTTTSPIPGCEDGTPPLCVGACNGLATCIDGGGGACICQSPPTCGGTFPACSGACATGQLCLPDVTSQSCLCTVPPVGLPPLP